MKPEELKDEISRLALSEKLLLAEDIWNSIAADNSELPLPEWQREVLDQRYKDYKEGKLGLHDWEVVHKKLRENHK